MGVIGSLTARMVLETGEYMAATEKVVRRTDSMSGQIGRIMQKAGNSYSKAIMGAGVGLFGAHALDEVIRNLGKELQQMDYSRVDGLARSFSRVAENVGEVVKGIPLIGAAFELGAGISMALDRSQQDERDAQKSADARRMQTIEARKADDDRRARAAEDAKKAESSINGVLTALENQKRLTDAIGESERIGIERQIEWNKMRKEMIEAQNKTGMSIEEKLAQLEDVRAKFDSITAKMAKDVQDKADMKDWLNDFDAWDKKMTEMEQRQGQLQEEASSRLAGMMNFGNAESLSTAIGGVKVAGMSSFSLERMMPTQDAIKLAVQQIAKNTAPLAAGAP